MGFKCSNSRGVAALTEARTDGGAFPNADFLDFVTDGTVIRPLSRSRWAHVGRWRDKAHELRCATAVLCFALAPAAFAQQHLVVRTPTARSVAGVELTRVTTLRSPGRESAFVLPTAVVRDERGVLYVLDWMNPSPVWVFDATGKLLRSISRERALEDNTIVRALAIGAPDTLHVLSGGSVIFDAAGRTVRRRDVATDASIFGFLVFPNGDLVLQAVVATPGGFGYPLHTIGTRGERVSFGAGKSEAFDGHPTRVMGSLAHAGGNRFWANTIREYRVRLWTTKGELQRVIDRQVDWFDPWTEWDGRIDVAPPPPRLISTWQDRAGRLITLTAVAARDWAPVTGRNLAREAPPPTAAEFERANDSVLEIIDPRDGSLVATQRIRGTMIAIVADSLVVGLSSGIGKSTGLDVWKFRLVPPQAR